jgi:NAD(P)-dependent dehydrogenase (short-subunit alcohol dehydrogenase family)
MPQTLRCDPKLFEKDLTGQVMIVTGANSGIGLETTRQLASQKATVILACRNEAKAKAAMDDIGYAENTVFIPLDLSDLSSVRKFVESFTSAYDRLDALVNNAGIMACPYSKTKDGFENQMGCNHLAHFLLFKLLTPILLKTAEDAGKPSRFISVSSCAASALSIGGGKYADIDFDDLLWESREYDNGAAYQQSKLANYLTAWEASKKYDSSKLISVSLHPG